MQEKDLIYIREAQCDWKRIDESDGESVTVRRLTRFRKVAYIYSEKLRECILFCRLTNKCVGFV